MTSDALAELAVALSSERVSWNWNLLAKKAAGVLIAQTARIDRKSRSRTELKRVIRAAASGKIERKPPITFKRFLAQVMPQKRLPERMKFSETISSTAMLHSRALAKRRLAERVLPKRKWMLFLLRESPRTGSSISAGTFFNGWRRITPLNLGNAHVRRLRPVTPRTENKGQPRQRGA